MSEEESKGELKAMVALTLPYALKPLFMGFDFFLQIPTGSASHLG
jgi:hypothetical protein